MYVVFNFIGGTFGNSLGLFFDIGVNEENRTPYILSETWATTTRFAI